MTKYKVDESNNKILVEPVDNSIAIPKGLYTEKELRKEVEKQFGEFKKRSFRLIFKNEKGPNVVSRNLGFS